VLFSPARNFARLDPPSWAEGIRWSPVFAGHISELVNTVGNLTALSPEAVVVAGNGKTQLWATTVIADDIRVAASDTRLHRPRGGARRSYPARRHGRSRARGLGQAMRYMLTVSKERRRARRMGLVQEVTGPAADLDRARGIAGKIAAKATLGVRRRAGLGPSGARPKDAALAATFPNSPADARARPPGIRPRAAGEADAGLSRTIVAKSEGGKH